MEAFTVLEAIVAPLDRPNVDTDAIIPKQFLKTIERQGLGKHLFDAWRYLEQDGKQVDNPDFILNQPIYADARILLARETLVVVPVVNMLPGPWRIMVSAPSSPPALRTSLRIIVYRTGFC